jgi:Meiotically up-regulated gene 113
MSRLAWLDDVPTPTDDEMHKALDEAGEGVVYFVQVGPNGPIKIGYSTRPVLKARVAAIQVGCPYKVHLRSTAPGTRTTERQLQRLFGDLRIRGEWFWPEAELAAIAGAEADTLP